MLALLPTLPVVACGGITVETTPLTQEAFPAYPENHPVEVFLADGQGLDRSWRLL